MTKRLGTISLASDILKTNKVGLWALEHDEEKEPRMYLDATALRLVGFSEQMSPEATYRTWYASIDYNSYGPVTDSLVKMTSGEHTQMHFRWFHPDGHVLMMSCSGTRNRSYTEGVRLEGVLQDVTAVARYQEQRIAERDVFNKHLLTPYVSAYYIDMANDTWKTYKRPDILKASYTQIERYSSSIKRYIADEVHPDDRDRASLMADYPELRRRLANQDVVSIVFRKISEEKEKLLLCEIIRGADEDHITLGFKDVTEEERAKKEWSNALDVLNQQRHFKIFGDMINAAFWSANIDSNDRLASVFWSDEFRHMLGYENTDDFPNTTDIWLSLLHPDDKAATVGDIFKAFKSTDVDNFVYDTKYRLLKKTGEYCWYHAVGRMEYIDVSTRRLFGIITDASLAKKLEEQNEALVEQRTQLEEALTMAQSANRAKTTFLNNISHDIRTPMNAIIGYTGLAASHIDHKEQVQGYLEKISQSSSHLLSLINDVLDMSRIESGNINLDEKPENLSDIIHTLRDIVLADVHAKQLDFFIDTEDIVDESIVCDKLRLSQVLLNILSNAIKYTANGGTVSMRITEKTVKSNGYAVYEFLIKDNGMGMSQELANTVFEPFKRGKSSTVSGIQGTGLGMTITQNIVSMMGGTIKVESELGKGTEVAVTLDFKLHEDGRKTLVIPEVEGMRALVADDDTNTCLSVYTLLKDVGLRSEWCTSGKEAVIRAQAAYNEGDLFRIYVIDWLMPDMNGIETTRRIRGVIGDDAPIVILTAYDWSDIEEEAREAGVTAFVSKPLFPSDLHKVLCDCFGEREQTNEDENFSYDFDGKKLLLVEDNEINCEIATELLVERGFVVDVARDGDIAVEKMKSATVQDYDFVLMDVQMPTMDGYEATRQIRALGTEISKIPIIAMTANAFEEDRKLALEAGMNDHVPKPIDTNLLERVIAKWL